MEVVAAVAGHWHGKPKALGCILGSSTFLLSPLPFQRYTESIGQIRSLIRPSLVRPQTRLIGLLITGLLAVITLMIYPLLLHHLRRPSGPKSADIMQTHSPG